MRYANLLLMIFLMTACMVDDETHKTFEMTSSKNSQDMFEKAGIPRSPKYKDDIQFLNIRDYNPEQKKDSLKPNDSKKKTNVSENQNSQKTTTKSNIAPWKNNAKLEHTEEQHLKADWEQAFEYMSIAGEGTQPQKNWELAAKLFVKASRYPDKNRRSNCLYNAACCYSLLNKKEEAIKYLSLAIKEFGFSDMKHIKQDSDLDNIRKEKDFIKLTTEKKIPVEKIEVEKDPAATAYQEADKLYDAKKFEEAAKKYLESTKSEKYTQKGYYNAACCYSLVNKKDLAMKWLKKALKSGWNKPEMLKNDSDLKNLHDLEEFKALLKK